MSRRFTKEELAKLLALLAENEGNQAETARQLKISRSTLISRLEIAARMGMEIPSRPSREYPATLTPELLPPRGRIHIEVLDGKVVAGSDFHYWPGPKTTAHIAFVHFIRRFREEGSLRAVVLDGDVLDFTGASRHPPIGWTSMPSPADEIEVAQERLAEIEEAAGPGVEKLWPAGNHDLRMETLIASKCPEVRGIKGTSLADHFPNWKPCWSVWVNDQLVIKHRLRGGVHAAFNNAVYAGKSVATGHLHRGIITPHRDYTGLRWGIDLGCVADPWSAQFQDYMEDNPRQWSPSFGVFTFEHGELQPPELVQILAPGVASYRGERIEL